MRADPVQSKAEQSAGITVSGNTHRSKSSLLEPASRGNNNSNSSSIITTASIGANQAGSSSPPAVASASSVATASPMSSTSILARSITEQAPPMKKATTGSLPLTPNVIRNMTPTPTGAVRQSSKGSQPGLEVVSKTAEPSKQGAAPVSFSHNPNPSLWTIVKEDRRHQQQQHQQTGFLPTLNSQVLHRQPLSSPSVSGPAPVAALTDVWPVLDQGTASSPLSLSQNQQQSVSVLQSPSLVGLQQPFPILITSLPSSANLNQSTSLSTQAPVYSFVPSSISFSPSDHQYS